MFRNEKNGDCQYWRRHVTFFFHVAITNKKKQMASSFPYLIFGLFVACLVIVVAMAKRKPQRPTKDIEGQPVRNDIIRSIKRKYDYKMDDLIFIPIKQGQCVIWDNEMYHHFVYANQPRLMMGPMDLNFDEVGYSVGYSLSTGGENVEFFKGKKIIDEEEVELEIRGFIVPQRAIHHNDRSVPIRYATTCHTGTHADSYPGYGHANDISIVVYLNDADGYFILQKTYDSDKDKFKAIDLSIPYKNYIIELHNELHEELRDYVDPDMLFTCDDSNTYENALPTKWNDYSGSTDASIWAPRFGNNWVRHKTIPSDVTLFLQKHMYDYLENNNSNLYRVLGPSSSPFRSARVGQI